MRVLVTCASRHSSTREIADALADGLVRRDLDARTLAIEEVDGLGSYEAVVLGSAVYNGRWLREAVGFAAGNAAELASMPVWLFSSGPLGPADHPFPATDPADVAELMRLTGAREHRLFAGRLERPRLGIAERVMVRAVHAPFGDVRDWAAVERFAADIAASLGETRAQG
jgi:menaquinone-dependent protoporphyrinogen oxidase